MYDEFPYIGIGHEEIKDRSIVYILNQWLLDKNIFSEIMVKLLTKMSE